MTYLAHWWPTLATAILCAFGSASVGLNEILHAPELPNYRRASLGVRLPMMAFSIALAFRSMDLFVGLWKHQPQLIGETAVLGGLTMVTYTLATLWDTASKRLPARVWRRLDRALWLASCGRHAPALTELNLQGAMVVAPRERTLPAMPRSVH